MPRIPITAGDKLVKALLKVGFEQIRRESSHVSLWREHDNLHITIPVHIGRTLGKGLLSRVLKDVGLSVEGLRKLL
ncbi:MAG: type II toxin-antitoxin system HicA family toxin [bacterium]